MSTLLPILQPVLGIIVFVMFAWLISGKYHHFPIKFVVLGITMQFILIAGFLYIPPLQGILSVLNQGVIAVDQATQQGTKLVFGYLGGGDSPFELSAPENAFILAFRALPIVIVFSALFALLWYWKVTPFLIHILAKVLNKMLGISATVGLGAAACIFVGMVEAPMVVKQKLSEISRSDFFVLMTCGMATVAGTVMGLYALILSPLLGDALMQILIASVASVPAAIMISKLMYPDDISDHRDIQTNHSTKHEINRYESTMHALTEGTQEGMRLFLSIIAMLIVFVALVHLCNQVLSLILLGGESLTLELLLGYVLQPVLWLIGIPGDQLSIASDLFAKKVIINEFIAYLQLAQLPPEVLSENSTRILLYALCGFSSFSGLGILIGGLLVLCPERKQDILTLAPKTLISGNLATCMTGAVLAILLSLQ